MDIKKIIIKHIILLIPNTHPVIYQYVLGHDRSKTTAIKRLTEIIYEYCNPYWFDDFFTIQTIRGVCKEYLEFINNEHKLGNITIKEIYQKYP